MEIRADRTSERCHTPLDAPSFFILFVVNDLSVHSLSAHLLRFIGQRNNFPLLYHNAVGPGPGWGLSR